MAKARLITRNIGNLRGFSTDSAFLRPANVADRAINIQKAPDNTLQIRRGFQAQIAAIGGMGIGTFDNPAAEDTQTVCVGMDGFLYNKLERQIFLYYNGAVSKNITGITQANPAVVTSVGHGLVTGVNVLLNNIQGMSTLNGHTYTITVIDVDHFSINVDSTLFPAYISGGTWTIDFTAGRYLTMSIFVDPLYIYTPAQQSISCNIFINQAAQVVGNQIGTTSITVKFGHEIATGDVIQFTDTSGVLQQKTVTGTTSTTISFAGAVSVSDAIYITQLIYIQFGKGFDQSGAAYTIQQFITAITDPTTGVYGLQVAVNGTTSYPAAFLQIFEPTIIDSNKELTLNYWYWQQVNSTFSPPLPGSANVEFQNSDDFEIASMAVFDDVIYICNGLDYPQKYDGQTVYRAGMPQGVRPANVIDDSTPGSPRPFTTGNVYQYAVTYEQIDNRNHLQEGEISEVFQYTAVANPTAADVTLSNLQSTSGNNWNTNCAIAHNQTATVYGPDKDGFYYDLLTVDAAYTLKIGDTAYYPDFTCAVTVDPNSATTILNVAAGHGVVAGDIIYVVDSSNVYINRRVISVTATTLTIANPADPANQKMTVSNNTNILVYKTGLVFGNVAISNSAQTNVNPINVNAGFTIQTGDVVQFIDADGNLQQRTVTATGATTITLSGINVSIGTGVLISSINQRSTAITIQRTNVNPIQIIVPNAAPNDYTAISNNLRINIYRTKQGQSFLTNGELYLVASVPNDSIHATQTYVDRISDRELQREFDDPLDPPNPPPISKYVLAFGDQLFFAGGERGNPDNSDNVFFSNLGIPGIAPESVPLAVNFFSVPNLDDDITGIGISGTSLVTTKTHSLWAATGNFLSGDIDVVQIAPGTSIGCIAHATIRSVAGLMYFLHTNGVYAITENQLYPTDRDGNPLPLSSIIDVIFRETNYLPQNRYVLKRATAMNYTKDHQYLLFLPCEDTQTTIRDANANSIILAYDYQHKNWFMWDNINAAGGFAVINDDLYWQERRFSTFAGNTANLYRQHRFYRLIDHADHTGAQFAEWRSSWEDLEQPEVRKKFSKCILLMDAISSLYQQNNPTITFSSYLNRIPNLQNTISVVNQTQETRNTTWSQSPWNWNYWSGYQDNFIVVNLKGGTVAKSLQVGLQIQGINMDMRLAGFQLEIIPENRMTVTR